MSDETTIGDIVALSAKDDAAGVKSAIGDVLQQKVMVSLEGKKQDFDRMYCFLHSTVRISGPPSVI